jgi:hypothetical protein
MGTAEEGSYAPLAIPVFLAVFGFYLYRERKGKANNATKAVPAKA